MDICHGAQNGTQKICITGIGSIYQSIPYVCQPTHADHVSFRSIQGKWVHNRTSAIWTKWWLPQLYYNGIANDPPSGTSPLLPSPKAAVEGNDPAPGRIVEDIAYSKFWMETCIFGTKANPQNELCHAGGHRTVGLVIVQYMQRGKRVSTYYSQINMVRGSDNILGVPPMNQLDLTANPMMSCSGNRSDYSHYTAVKKNYVGSF